MKKQLLIVFLVLQSILSIAQERVTLSGSVVDSNNNETVIGVLVEISELKISTFTNEYGFFSLTVPKGFYNLQVSTIGYETKIIEISLQENSKLAIEIKANTKELDAVIINKNQ